MAPAARSMRAVSSPLRRGEVDEPNEPGRENGQADGRDHAEGDLDEALVVEGPGREIGPQHRLPATYHGSRTASPKLRAEGAEITGNCIGECSGERRADGGVVV